MSWALWALEWLAIVLAGEAAASTVAHLTYDNLIQAPADWRAAARIAHRFQQNARKGTPTMEDTMEDTMEETQKDFADEVEVEGSPKDSPKSEDIWKTVELPTGRTAVIRPGVVADHNRAIRLARERGGDGVDQGVYLTTLFAELVEIDGETFTREEVEQLPLQEYFPVQQTLDELANPPT